ncbi:MULTISPECIES: DNA-packaging protein FI [Hafnia]|uniref:DNA-packaging protein FI n=1 Tax=Hafnia TaxID=568 RepID=UPI001F434AC1|nr:DNA-packaging protein FI [Hafnia paralvei]MCE9902498.1 DNA-packaging protein FI [Hafnia paralvei]MCE9921771.1 DNA-packaging protein FI [Hafnia paralvei]
MATPNKDELIGQLQALSAQLGRDADINGTAAELQMRIREAQDELDALNDDDGDEQASVVLPVKINNDESTFVEGASWVPAVACKTLHIRALHAERDEALALICAGEALRVAADEADALATAGLVTLVQ